MIADTITQKIGEALKSHDDVRLSTLRMLSSALNYERIAKQHQLSEDEELAVVKKEAKNRNDAIESLKAAEGKNTSATPEELKKRIAKEEEELKILKSYLPEEISESELTELVDQVIKDMGVKDIKGMGQVIGAVKAKVGMRGDGATIAKLVREKLG
jgi:uncharacterized protein